MRYPLEGRSTVAGLTMGGGALAAVAGLARGLTKRALGPMALPVVIGTGLWWLGRTLGNGFVEIRSGWLHLKLGAMFDEVIPLSAIEAVEPSTWNLLGGLGVRSNMRDVVAVTTRSGAVAEITFKSPQSLPVLPLVWRVRAERLIVSPERLDEFIAELRGEIGQTETDSANDG